MERFTIPATPATHRELLLTSGTIQIFKNLIIFNFPEKMLKNPYINLFIDKTAFVNSISDQEIINYVRNSNYLDKVNPGQETGIKELIY
ncbi:hypothetical protein HTH_0196 [Hydrogenobacter thermophilus TK-6]|uniref:Uncharacterized protein n=2 Tax=Hydrogenobacter thermophilus TaxID=940 RepID=D3DFR1_HYDTT|nr:hypothetical protein HTH_0196 [Hydrogenobacter thermophilus TK-6]